MADCAKCGQGLPDTAKFCLECGTPVWREPVVAAPPTPTSQPEPAAVQRWPAAAAAGPPASPARRVALVVIIVGVVVAVALALALIYVFVVGDSGDKESASAKAGSTPARYGHWAQAARWEMDSLIWPEVEFAGAGSGWVLLQNGDADTGELSRSTDGGENWEPVTDAVVSGVGTAYYGTLVVADPAHLLLTGGSDGPAVSADGGATWKLPTSGGNQNAYMSFGDAQHGMSVDPDAEGTVMATADGGATWSQVSLPLGPGGAPLRSQDVAMVGSASAWVVGAWNTDPEGTDDVPAVLRTRDLGQTWQSLTLPSMDNTILWYVAFVDDRHGWATGDAGIVLRTSDGGDTWQTSPWGFADVNPTSMAFADQKTGWIVGTDDASAATAVALTQTTDGGATWKREDLDGSGLGVFVPTDVCAVDAHTAWVIGFDTPQGSDVSPSTALLFRFVEE